MNSVKKSVEARENVREADIEGERERERAGVWERVLSNCELTNEKQRLRRLTRPFV